MMIFLYVLMQGIILGGKVPPEAVAVLSRIWAAGIIPAFVGLGLIINGTLVSKKQLEATRRANEERYAALRSASDPRLLDRPEPSAYIPSEISVTEGTTRQLANPAEKN
jgi:hypothetical protein